VIGLDFGLLKHLHIRGGYRINYDEEKITFGAGFLTNIGQSKIVIDYAYKDFINLTSTHQFTLGFQF